jgi:hypothetical protein
MSEEDDQLAMELNASSGDPDLENAPTEAAPSEDFDQNGLLLKIAVNGITVQDYVKKLQESDILVEVKYIEMGRQNSVSFLKVELERKRNGYFLFGVMGKFLISL